MQDFKFYIRFSWLFCVFALSACMGDSFPNIPEEWHTTVVDKPRKEVDARFQLQLGAGTIRKSPNTNGIQRIPSIGTLNGTDEENEIKTLTFFIVDFDEVSGLEDWTWVKYVSTFVPNPLPATIDVSIKTNIGKKHVYVGANMSVAQIMSFCANKGRYTTPRNTYNDIIKDFTDPGRGFVMFGQMEITATSSPTIEIHGGDVISTKVDLHRVVSKVALTYTPALSKGEGYATIADGIGGFIDTDSIYFMLNATSKSIDFIQNATGSRYNMVDYIAKDNDPTHQTLYYYTTNPTTDFMFYTPQKQVPDAVGSIYETAKIKLPVDFAAGEDNPYHNGGLMVPTTETFPHPSFHYTGSSLYCLENTVSTNGFESEPDLTEFRKGINTHVVVAAKYIPDSIYHYDSTNDVMEVLYPTNHANREDIHTAMEVITDNDPNGAYTFYAVLIPASSPAVYKYYTYDAKEHLEENDDAPNFITYKKGYGYYSTFVTQDHSSATDEDYNLIRNNYYILNVKEFIPPGAVYPQQLYMLINSRTVEWSFQKEIDVPLD